MEQKLKQFAEILDADEVRCVHKVYVFLKVFFVTGSLAVQLFLDLGDAV